LTGAPGVGKTTVLIKAANALKAHGVTVGGMISREVRQGGTRVGFEILDLASDKHGWLARVDQKAGPQIGKYRVNIEDLENIGAKAIVEAVEKCAVVAIDEVGPMELFSPKFKIAVKQALNSGKLVLAVVHAKARDPLITIAKQSEDAQIFVVTSTNRDSLPESLTKQVLDTIDGILFKPKLTTFDLAGTGVKYATAEEMKKLLDELRGEES
jgi:nucleoside-triphosphatase